MGQELAGKVAIVTGGVGGLGRATVELFVREGAKAVIADTNAAAGEQLAAQLGAATRFRQADVADPQQVQALVDLAVAEFGGLHIMFNNAGISGAAHARFLDDELADFEQVMRVNLLGVMLGTQRASRHMARHGGGSIINTASIAGQQAGLGLMTYRASKAAVIHFTKSAAIDLAAHGIRVNGIAPGNIRTAMSAFDASLEAQKAQRLSQALDGIRMAAQPLKRSGTADDVAQAALYLGSDRSAQVTGTVMTVDGGITAGDPVNHLQAIMAARRDVLGG